MKDFPIDSRGEIGRKRVKVPSAVMNKMEEGVFIETIRKVVRTKLREQDPCWKGYKQIGMKKKDGKEVPNCVPESYDVYNEDEGYTLEFNQPITEAEYQGRKVKLNKPMQGDSKKFKVYVKNEKGNVVVVHFGQKGMNIKKSNPERRKSFRARHNCDNPGPKHKARYWSCRKW